MNKIKQQNENREIEQQSKHLTEIQDRTPNIIYDKESYETVNLLFPHMNYGLLELS